MLTIAGVAAAGAILNAVIPMVSRSSGAVSAAGAKVDDRLKTDLEVVHVVGELDSSGVFQDTDGDGKFDIFVWVKNVGSTRVAAIEQSDVFLGKTGQFVRIPHETEVQAGVYPRWGHSIEGDSEGTVWEPQETLKVSVTYNSTQSQGYYDVKVVAPIGVSDDYFFSM
jgi:archaellum component FlaG (FlaF/FlaG flagellin family)